MMPLDQGQRKRRRRSGMSVLELHLTFRPYVLYLFLTGQAPSLLEVVNIEADAYDGMQRVVRQRDSTGFNWLSTGLNRTQLVLNGTELASNGTQLAPNGIERDWAGRRKSVS